MPHRPLSALLAALALVFGCGGCAAVNSLMRTTGISGGPDFDLPDSPVPPPDLRLTVSVRDQSEPKTDYLLQFDRSGNTDYVVTFRAPRRMERKGSFQILETQVESLWNALRDARFDELPDRIPEDGRGRDDGVGVQEFYVFANGLDKRVEAHFQRVEPLTRILSAALATVPDHVLAETPGLGDGDFVADTAANVFHVTSCPQLEEVPDERLRPFESRYDAVNFGFGPCPECRPLESRER